MQAQQQNSHSSICSRIKTVDLMFQNKFSSMTTVKIQVTFTVQTMNDEISVRFQPYATWEEGKMQKKVAC